MHFMEDAVAWIAAFALLLKGFDLLAWIAGLFTRRNDEVPQRTPTFR